MGKTTTIESVEFERFIQSTFRIQSGSAGEAYRRSDSDASLEQRRSVAP
jgi:hypothetical protein